MKSFRTVKREVIKNLYTLLVVSVCLCSNLKSYSQLSDSLNNSGNRIITYKLDDQSYKIILDSIRESNLKLNKRIDSIVDSLRDGHVIDQRSKYRSEYKKFKYGLMAFWEIYKLNRSINGSISKDYYSTMAEKINNPNEKELGFSLTDILLGKADSLSQKRKISKNQTSIFLGSMKNVLLTVSKNIPGVNVVASILESVSSYIPPKVKTALNNPFGQGYTNDFIEVSKPYIGFYNTLKERNEKYLVNLNILTVKYSRSKDEIELTRKEIERRLKLNFEKTLIDKHADSIFNHVPDNELTIAEITRIINSEDVRWFGTIISSIIVNAKSTNDLYADYSASVTENHTKLIELLDIAKQLKGSDIDKINDLKRNISVAKVGGTTTDNQVLIGFENSLSLYHSDLNKYLSNILF